jgi:hypothetical protein
MALKLPRLFKVKNTRPVREPARYEKEKAQLQNADIDVRLKMARHAQTHPEILYYLAVHDENLDVRRAVIQNEATPIQVSSLLSIDQNEDIRYAMAERLVKLLPSLDTQQQGQVYSFAVEALGNLALDEVLKIRKLLSSALKDQVALPQKIAVQLASDIERDVAEPILRFCMKLSDDDLISVIKNHPAPWVSQAIARREELSNSVAIEVINQGDEKAGLYLLENQTAEISDDLLQDIVAQSKYVFSWQDKVAIDLRLSPKMALQLSRYADLSVRQFLLSRTDFEKELLDDIAETFRKRHEAALEEWERAEQVADRVARIKDRIEISDDAIASALALRDFSFLNEAIALKADWAREDVARVIALRKAKPIIAMAYQSHLSMRMALKFQQEWAQIPHTEIIYPREGIDYPLSHDEIAWQLDFLGLKFTRNEDS